MQTVILNNGAEEAAPLVTVTMMLLRRMMSESPIVFYEFVCKCRDPHHQMWGSTEQALREYDHAFLARYNGTDLVQWQARSWNGRFYPFGALMRIGGDDA